MATKINEAHIVRFFTRMLHLYPHKWDRAYGPAMTGQGNDRKLSASARQWLLDLSELSAEQLLIGMDMVMKRRPEWPPGPLEFMDLCEGTPTVEQILARDVDYGPVCAAIRAKLDWYSIDGMSSQGARAAVSSKREVLLERMREDGSMRGLALKYQQQRMAVAAPISPAISAP